MYPEIFGPAAMFGNGRGGRSNNLRVFGYSAHPPRSRIGSEIRAITGRYWSRFAIRFSNSTLKTRSANTIHYRPGRTRRPRGNRLPCPNSCTEACATRGLCWTTNRNIVFPTERVIQSGRLRMPMRRSAGRALRRARMDRLLRIRRGHVAGSASIGRPPSAFRGLRSRLPDHTC